MCSCGRESMAASVRVCMTAGGRGGLGVCVSIPCILAAEAQLYHHVSYETMVCFSLLPKMLKLGTPGACWETVSA